MRERITPTRLQQACKVVRSHIKQLHAQYPGLEKSRGYGPVLYAEDDDHLGIGVGWLETILAAAEAQSAALQSIKNHNESLP